MTEKIITGYETLDSIPGGFLRPGEVCIVAARPGMGKTAFALNIAEKLMQKTKVLYYSLEMSREQLAERILTIRAGTADKVLSTADIGRNEQKRLTESAGSGGSSNLFINDAPFVSAAQIEKEADTFFDNAAGVVIIDYLQLMGAQSPTNTDRKTEFCGIMKDLKLCAERHNLSIIVLSQSSRAPEYRKDHRPLLAAPDLPDTFEAVKEADVIAFLYRERYYDFTAASEEMEIILAKHPAAEPSTILLGWDADRMHIYGIKRK